MAAPRHERLRVGGTLVALVADEPRGGMRVRSWDTMACIKIQATVAIVPWMPVMAGTLTT
jgi:hypothetical protein